MRRRYLAGNWKMNLDRRGALALAAALREGVGRTTDRDVAVFPPFVYLDEVARALAGSAVRVGAQNVCDEEVGAFTGEVCASMLLDVGATTVLVGHSERRHLYGEDDALVNRKLRGALKAGLEVVLCLGETLDQRQANETERVTASQLTRGLEGVEAAQLERVTIAYEPVWAIGTGQNATAAQAGEVHSYLRGVLSGLYGDARAEIVRILYGGSVKASNAAELLGASDVDGALVGGASLDADSFLQIVRAEPAARR